VRIACTPPSQLPSTCTCTWPGLPMKVSGPCERSQRGRRICTRSYMFVKGPRCSISGREIVSPCPRGPPTAARLAHPAARVSSSARRRMGHLERGMETSADEGGAAGGRRGIRQRPGDLSYDIHLPPPRANGDETAAPSALPEDCAGDHQPGAESGALREASGLGGRA